MTGREWNTDDTDDTDGTRITRMVRINTDKNILKISEYPLDQCYQWSNIFVFSYLNYKI